MSSILFKKIRFKNFLSYGNEFTEIDLTLAKTNLVVGKNGAGKSALLDAITFALFNKPFRKINKPQLLNSITKRELVVEIEFESGSSSYLVRRGVKPSLFEIVRDGMVLNQSAESKDYQEMLERQILRVNYKAFCQVVVLGSASFVPFMDLPLGQRREIIEDLLDLQVFSKMNVLLKDKVAQNSLKSNEVEAEKNLTEQEIRLTREKLKSIQDLTDKILDEKRERIQEADRQIRTLAEAGKKIEEEIGNKAKETIHEDKLRSKIQSITKIKSQIEAKLDNLRSEIDFFEKSESCPTCQREIDPDFRSRAIVARTCQAVETSDGLESLMKEYELVSEEINRVVDLNSKLTDLKIESHSLKTKIISQMEYKRDLEREIDRISSSSQNGDECLSKIQELESRLKSVLLKKGDLLLEKETLTIASSLLKDGGIKSRIISQYVPIINKLINGYLSMMEFMVQFELNESFEEKIKSRFRDDFSYSSFSEGEKMRINLAILFTWRAIAKMRNSISTNLLVMDEIFDSSLDSSGTDELMKILSELTSDSNVFIISHKGDQLFEKFDRVLRFDKVKNFSKLSTQ